MPLQVLNEELARRQRAAKKKQTASAGFFGRLWGYEDGGFNGSQGARQFRCSVFCFVGLPLTRPRIKEEHANEEPGLEPVAYQKTVLQPRTWLYFKNTLHLPSLYKAHTPSVRLYALPNTGGFPAKNRAIFQKPFCPSQKTEVVSWSSQAYKRGFCLCHLNLVCIFALFRVISLFTFYAQPSKAKEALKYKVLGVEGSLSCSTKCPVCQTSSQKPILK